jgi:hypothetical protein
MPTAGMYRVCMGVCVCVCVCVVLEGGATDGVRLRLLRLGKLIAAFAVCILLDIDIDMELGMDLGMGMEGMEGMDMGVGMGMDMEKAEDVEVEKKLCSSAELTAELHIHAPFWCAIV